MNNIIDPVFYAQVRNRRACTERCLIQQCIPIAFLGPKNAYLGLFSDADNQNKLSHIYDSGEFKAMVARFARIRRLVQSDKKCDSEYVC